MRRNGISALISCAITGVSFAAGTTALAPTPYPDIITNSATLAHDPHPGSFDGPLAVDNLISADTAAVDTGLLFAGSDDFMGNQQRMAVTGFNSGINEIWLHSLINDGGRLPASVVIKSSTISQTSLVATDYETLLTPTAIILGFPAFTNVPVVVDPMGDPPYFGARYAIISVNAPVGTQSLFLDFGHTNTDMTGGNGARIQEIQAFYVPEPATLGTVVLGSLTLLARKRA